LIVTKIYLSMAEDKTHPPSSIKKEEKSVPPPKKLIRNGVCTMIKKFSASLNQTFVFSVNLPNTLHGL
jgi:hypothetical protein